MKAQVIQAKCQRTTLAPILGDGTYAWKCAQANAVLGNKTKAFEWLEKCFQAKPIVLTWVKYDPLLNSLHADTRFQGFLKKLNFPEN